ncbi:MAG: Hsp20/alpha crystallin family protein [Bacteroidota bacterium]
MTKKNDAAIVKQASNALAVRPESGEEFITPAADIYETPHAFVLHLDLPGAVRDGVQVNIEAERLSIKARVKAIHGEDVSILYHEIANKSYYRSFNLTKGIDTDRIEAAFQEGVLSVTIPKSEQFRRKEIKIQ